MENNKIKYGLTLITLACLMTLASAQSTDLAPTNMVVDFDSSSIDTNLRAGDTGVLNLVITNSGGRRAEDVEVYIPTSGSINVDKRFEVGRLDAGASKSLPVLIRVDKDAPTGLSAVNIRILYDGYDNVGDEDNDQLTTWNYPLRIYGDPSFQITALKTTYFKDILDDLVIEGKVLDPVKDLEATFSSSCITVIGSSRQYIGSINVENPFNLNYKIKPTTSGACSASILLEYTDESGSSSSDNITIGLNVEDSGIDFKVVSINYEPTGPGETVAMKIGLKNVGKANSEDTTMSLSLTSPFVPVDTSEKYLGMVGAGETIETQFDIAVGWDADVKAYAIPLTIFYKVGGMTYNVSKDIGIDIGGKIILEIINIDTSRGNVRVEVANIGTRTADGVKAILELPANRSSFMTKSESNGAKDLPTERRRNSTKVMSTAKRYVAYKSDIKTNKETTFTFDTTASGPAKLIIEYTGLNNKRITEEEQIMLGSGGSTYSRHGGSKDGSTGTSTTTYLIYIIIIVVLALVARKFYRGMKSG